MAQISGTPNQDELLALSSGDELLGLDGDDTLDATGGDGNNVLRGGDGNDELLALRNDRLFGDAGNDILDATAGEGDNQLDGGEGDDILRAGSNDELSGGEGNDLLFGGAGGSTLTGDAGNDQFWIASAQLPSQPYIITDFTQGEDVIGIGGFANVQDFDDLIIEQQGDDTLLKTPDNQPLAILQDVVLDTGNRPPTVEQATFSVSENSPNGTSVGEVVASDPDNDSLRFTITQGNLDPNGDGENVVIINETTGEIRVNDSQDLDFELSPSFNFTVEATDEEGLADSATITVNLTDIEENSPPVAEDDTFSLPENSPDGTVIGIVTASDPDDESLTYAIASGNDDTNTNKTPAFSINPATGELQVNDSRDLDFETTPTFNLSVEVTDEEGLSDTAQITINLTDTNDASRLTYNRDNSFSLGGNEAATLSFQLLANSDRTLNEVGVFAVEDEQGTINGLTPNDTGYLQAALSQAQVIFSTLADPPNNFDANVSRIVEGFDPATRLVFYLVRGSTTEDILAGQASSEQVILGASFGQGQSEALRVEDSGNGKFTLFWEDGSQGGETDFTDLVLTLELSEAANPPIGTPLQGQPQGELIDLRSLTGQVSVNFNVYREAAFDNYAGLYVIDDEAGTVNGIAPNEAGYAEVALSRRIENLELFAEDRSQAAFSDRTLEGGLLFAPYIIADGTVTEFLENNPDNQLDGDSLAYFAYRGANPDGIDHIRLLGDNTFAFEDWYDGGDADYNDLVVEVDF